MPKTFEMGVQRRTYVDMFQVEYSKRDERGFWAGVETFDADELPKAQREFALRMRADAPWHQNAESWSIVLFRRRAKLLNDGGYEWSGEATEVQRHDG